MFHDGFMKQHWCILYKGDRSSGSFASRALPLHVNISLGYRYLLSTYALADGAYKAILRVCCADTTHD